MTGKREESVSLAGPGESEFILYQTDDGLARVDVRLHEGTVWLTQKQLAELYQVRVPTVNQHLRHIFAEEELDPGATVRQFLIVRTEGNRSTSRAIEHYSLPVVLAVGYRVRSLRGTQFRQWATARLAEYAVKGFTLDDDRLKNPGAGTSTYFEELLARIRDIRSSEKVFYKKVLEIYATSIDYDPRAETSKQFFATVQNKMHWAAHGRTAAEVIVERADATQPHMGLTSWAGGRPRRSDVTVAKNYLDADELQTLNRIVTAYLEFAELQATRRRPMHMANWITKLDEYLKLSEREVLQGAGSVSHQDAIDKAHRELDRYDAERAMLPAPVEADFDAAVRDVEGMSKQRPATPKKR